MALQQGTQLGPYEIVSPIGSGGMGEVYRARDTRLDRTVAIKVLSSDLSSDSELRGRMQREARAISSLNHPHICTLYDIGQESGIDFLVMEFLQGESLAERLRKGPLPLIELLRYAMEIADALEKAHREGIVHRDLKPGNIMLTKSGAKLLDFGLAKMRPQAEKSDAVSTLPTRHDPVTKKGVVLGTFQYMAPEQLEGKDADSRTDLFAFGAVLYEMATGKRAFNATSEASLIAAILKEEPTPLSRVQPLTPFALENLVKSCLVKDPEERLQNATDLKHALQWISDSISHSGSQTSPTVSSRRSLLPWALFAAAVLVGAILVAFLVSKRSGENALSGSNRVILVAPPEHSVTNLAVSPDGKTVVFVTSGSAGRKLHLRHTNRFETIALAGTDGAEAPFFSPDGKWIAFFASDKLKKIPVTGGNPITICDAFNDWGGTWNVGGTIVFTPLYGSGLASVSADGGTPQPFTSLNVEKGERAHSWPHFLPDGKSILYTIQAGPGFETRKIALYSLETKQTKVLIEQGAHPRFANDHIIFSRDSTLFAVPFDRKRQEITGAAFTLLDGVLDILSEANSLFDVSPAGTFAFVPGPALGAENRRLAWLDRKGGETSISDQQLPYYMPRISPDGRKLAVSVYQEGRFVIAILDLERGTWSRLPTQGSSAYAVWTPDGNRIAYSSDALGPNGIFWHSADGAGNRETLVTSASVLLPGAWTPDGQEMVLTEVDQETSGNVGRFFLKTPGKFEAFRKTSRDEFSPALSPDGKWIAYSSNESGSYEIYLEAYPGPGRRWQISSGNGENFEPVFSRNGRELFFTRLESRLYSVSLSAGPDPRPSKPLLVTQDYHSADLDGLPGYDVAPDGRLVIVRRPEIAWPAEVRVFLNWSPVQSNK
ncbi:protein kinase [bacterium]|nr:protein kinase [bacterium]